MKLSHCFATVNSHWIQLRAMAMLMKLLSLQKILDSIFDERWISLGLIDAALYDHETSKKLLET